MLEREAQGRELADSRIIGGSNAGKNLYEWFAMPIQKNGNQLGCGGALVAPEFVLTAVCISPCLFRLFLPQCNISY